MRRGDALVQLGRRGGRSGRARAAGLASALAVVLLAGCAGTDTSGGTDAGGDAAEEITLGAVVPLTGPNASLGAAWKAGIELALDVVNADGGVEIDGQTHRLAVDMLDDESTPAGAQRAVQQLLADGEKFWLGPCLSSSFQTAYGTIEGTDTQLVLTPSAASEAFLGEGSDLLFKTQASQGGGGIGKFADFLIETYAPTTVAVLQPQNPTGDLISDALLQAFEAAGIQVVYNNQSDPATTDYTPFISAIRSANPDLVVGPYVDSYMAPMMDQAVQVGYTQPVFANYGGSLAALGDNADSIADFAWQPVTRAVDNADDPLIADFRAKYQEKYGSEPTSIDFYALSFYDPVIMLAEAMEKAGTIEDPAAVGAQMRGITEWPQQVLPFEFDATGLAHYTFQVGTLEDGAISYVDLGLN